MDPGFTLTLITGHLHNFRNLAIVRKKKRKQRKQHLCIGIQFLWKDQEIFTENHLDMLAFSQIYGSSTKDEIVIFVIIAGRENHTWDPNQSWTTWTLNGLEKQHKHKF